MLEAVPTKHQAAARTRRCALPYAETHAAGEARRVPFDTRYRQLAPKAVERWGGAGARRVTFSQCPRAPGRPLRTTKVVESPVAAVRLRTPAATRFTQVDTAPAMRWNVRQLAERTFRRLPAPALRPAVYAGVTYVDGIKQLAVTHQESAA